MADQPNPPVEPAESDGFTLLEAQKDLVRIESSGNYSFNQRRVLEIIDSPLDLGNGWTVSADYDYSDGEEVMVSVKLSHPALGTTGTFDAPLSEYS